MTQLATIGARLISAYEDKHFSVTAPDPIEVILLKTGWSFDAGSDTLDEFLL